MNVDVRQRGAAAAWRVGVALVLGVCGGVVASGCHEGWRDMYPARHKEQKQAEWNRMRAEIKLQLAREQYELGYFDQAARYLGESAEADPSVPGLTLLGARIAMARGDEPGARRYLAALRSQPDPPAEAFYLAGMLAFQHGEWVEAEREFAMACAADGDNLGYRLFLARCRLEAGRPDLAIEGLKAAEDLGRFSGEYHRLLGDALMAAGRVEEATRAYEMARLYAPDEPAIQEALCIAYLERGEWESGQAMLARLREREGETSAAIAAAEVRCLLGRGQVREARQRLHALLARQREDARLWMLEAQAAVIDDDLEAARRAVERAVALAPQDAGVRQLGAVVALRREAWDEAAGYLEEAARLAPGDPLTPFLWSRLWSARGDALRERQWLVRCLALNSDFEPALAALTRLYLHDQGR